MGTLHYHTAGYILTQSLENAINQAYLPYPHGCGPLHPGIWKGRGEKRNLTTTEEGGRALVFKWEGRAVWLEKSPRKGNQNRTCGDRESDNNNAFQASSRHCYLGNLICQGASKNGRRSVGSTDLFSRLCFVPLQLWSKEYYFEEFL